MGTHKGRLMMMTGCADLAPDHSDDQGEGCGSGASETWTSVSFYCTALICLLLAAGRAENARAGSVPVLVSRGGTATTRQAPLEYRHTSNNG